MDNTHIAGPALALSASVLEATYPSPPLLVAALPPTLALELQPAPSPTRPLPYRETTSLLATDPDTGIEIAAPRLGLLFQPPPFRPLTENTRDGGRAGQGLRATPPPPLPTLAIPTTLPDDNDDDDDGNNVSSSSRPTGAGDAAQWLSDLLAGVSTSVAPGLPLTSPIWGSRHAIDNHACGTSAVGQRKGHVSSALSNLLGNDEPVTVDNLFDGAWLWEGVETATEAAEDGLAALSLLDRPIDGDGEGDGDVGHDGVEGGEEEEEEEEEEEVSPTVEVADHKVVVGRSSRDEVLGNDDLANIETELNALLASGSTTTTTRAKIPLPSESGRGRGKGRGIGGKGGRSVADDHAAPTSTFEWAVLQHQEFNLDQEYEKLRPHMAKQYPFELDTFQKDAVCLMERGESVFVAAHTSAGKTVVAEYAFALTTRHKTRAVYTSPIKTISNQKFRDLRQQFDVGLLTGDVSIRPEASCLIMTTEILRSMLYRGADLVRDLEWVVFDEVHYVNDMERGVVWEEVIIMLPPHVGIVMLSATVPNVAEFADWVGRTKRKRMFVTGTTKRPVPLEHHLYHRGESYKVCAHEKFIKEGVAALKRAIEAVPGVKDQGGRAPSGGGRGGPSGGGRSGGRGKQADYIQRQLGGRGGGRGGGGGNSGQGFLSAQSWLKMVEYLERGDLTPAVIFCFSKKNCDRFPDLLRSKNFTSPSEKSQIHVFCTRALSRLSPGDRDLPQIRKVRSLLERGIGVHHAGLLPIMKEVVEMLFCRGLIRLLFCTETFAMGVNAPARTVIFQAIRKHDGTQVRHPCRRLFVHIALPSS